MIQRPRGTRDFATSDMPTRRQVEADLRNTAISFGYHEISTPTFEDAELFIKKSGPEVVKQLYIFRDKGDRELVLRPELTAPAIRFYATELYKQPKPLKIFYMGNCFRYERPQKGRFREFWQFGVEIIGTDKAEAIAELISLACYCLKNVGLKSFELRVGALEILKTILADWDIYGEEQSNFFTALDKGDIETLRIILENTGRTHDEVEKFFELVQDKVNINVFEERKAKLLENFPSIEPHLTRLDKVMGFLKLFGVTDFFIDLSIARGLDYYTGIVFELDVESLGAEKQVCGGGEYSLNELFDLNNIATSGFAIGFDRVVLATELEGIPKVEPELDIYVIPLNENGLEKAIQIVQQLRDSGYKVDLDLKGRNMSKNLKYASSKSVKYVMFLGEDELAKGVALVREMASGEQAEVDINQVIEYFDKQ